VAPDARSHHLDHRERIVSRVERTKGSGPPGSNGEKLFDRYIVLERLGQGGMGEVYKAFDERLRCDVALKFLRESHRSDEKARARFLREARALARINHPNICNVRDFLEHQGTDILVMEFVEGIPLHRKLSDGPLLERDVMRLGIQLADGLGAAHDAGVLHRDLKPANIAILTDGRLKILDFGLAKMTTGDEISRSFSTTDSVVVQGTLPYIAPELLKGAMPDVRSDLYSVGCVLYEMCTGQHAYPDDDPLKLWHAILNLEPVAPRRVQPLVSSRLERVVLRCMAKEPDLRYATTADLSDDLRVTPKRGLAAWIRTILAR
jgi:serine/threonine protein kinase